MDIVVRAYGYTPNRAGFIKCPLHTGDRTASLKVYPDRRGWYCFGCHRGGTVIDFVVELFGLDPLDAAKKLNTDFHLGLDLEHREPTPQERQEYHRRREVRDTYGLFEQWRDKMIRQLNACFLMAHLAMKSLETPEDLDKLTDAQALAIREQARIEYYANLLSFGAMDEQMAIFRERGRIGQLCEKILNRSPAKSGAA